MKRYLIFGVLLLIQGLGSGLALGQTFKGLKLLAGGKPITYAQLLMRCKESDVIFFGELHDDSLAHAAELELLHDLAQFPQPLALGLEMLETEDQTVLNEYLNGQATRTQLEASANLWENWDSDYLPLVDFAKSRRVPVLATNVPRRYASLVAKRGLPALDSLSDQAQAWMTPLPLTVPYRQPSYLRMRDMMGGGHGSADSTGAQRMVAAQTLKDATMAYVITRGWPSGGRLLHINGSYHSDYNEGIVTYLKKLDPRTRTLTISYRRKDNEDVAKKDLADVVVIGN